MRDVRSAVGMAAGLDLRPQRIFKIRRTISQVTVSRHRDDINEHHVGWSALLVQRTLSHLNKETERAVSLQGTDSCIWPSSQSEVDIAEVEAVSSFQPTPPNSCLGDYRERPNRLGKAGSDRTGRAVAELGFAAQPFGINYSLVARFDHCSDVADTSDEMLIGYVAEGDKAAMRIIFIRHRTRLFRFVFRLIHNRESAEDIVSQVFLDVWRFAHRFEYRARVSTWLLSMARFKAINFMRRKTHQCIEQIDLVGAADTGDTPEAATDRGEVCRILRMCLEELSPAHRQVIDLFYYRDYSVSELSDRIGIPQATVKSRLFYARKHLARVLTRVGLGANSIRQSCSERVEGTSFAVPIQGSSID